MGEVSTIPLNSHFNSKKPPSPHIECPAMGRLQLPVSLLSLFPILAAGKWLSQRAIRQSRFYSARVISRLSANMLLAGNDSVSHLLSEQQREDAGRRVSAVCFRSDLSFSRLGNCPQPEPQTSCLLS